MMTIGSQRADTPMHPGFYFHPEAHVGSGGTPDARPAPPPELDSTITPGSTTRTNTLTDTIPAPDGNAVSTNTVN